VSAFSAISAYTKVGMESDIASASPHELIVILYKAAVVSVQMAKTQLAQGDIPGKGASISKAIMLIGSGLQASLNREVGGQLAQNLYDLYSYMIQRLMEANLNSNVALLDEVEGLLVDLQGAWESINRPAVSGYQDAHPAGTYAARA